MAFLQKTSRLNNALLKIFSLFLGYALWQIFSYSYKIETKLSLPLFFYNKADQALVQAPETIKVSLYGTRTELFKVASKGSIHCDATTLSEGTQKIKVAEQNIFLPETIRLVHYTPQEIKITVTTKKEELVNT